MTRCSVCGAHINGMCVIDASADRITFDKDVAHDLRFAWLNEKWGRYSYFLKEYDV